MEIVAIFYFCIEKQAKCLQRIVSVCNVSNKRAMIWIIYLVGFYRHVFHEFQLYTPFACHWKHILIINTFKFGKRQVFFVRILRNKSDLNVKHEVSLLSTQLQLRTKSLTGTSIDYIITLFPRKITLYTVRLWVDQLIIVFFVWRKKSMCLLSKYMLNVCFYDNK